MQSISDFMNRFTQAMQLKDFYSMEKLYQEMKKQFGDFVFEEERKGNIRFRKKLYQTTFFYRDPTKPRRTAKRRDRVLKYHADKQCRTALF